MKLKNIKCLLAVCLCASALLVGCGQKTDSKTADKSETSSESTQNQSEDIQEASRDVFAMDTYMTVTAYGENAEAAVDAAKAEIERLDALLSTGDADSEIAKLNADGAFDIAIYPVMEAWGFPTQNFQIPSQEALDQLLPLTDAGNISYDKETRKISFGVEGMKIDLGGIAKGYTSSRIMDIYKDNGITSGLVNLGGNVQALGTKTDGTKWKIAVQSPDDTEDYLGILSVQDKAVITSGGYERYFEQDGVTYHHIIDPKTGYPAESGLVSVTIVSTDGTLADGLSTSLFIMGEEKAADFWREHKDEFDAILMSDDGTLYVTEGLENDFSTERTVEIIR
jgi:thiamine biosynthesis lipoprotein